MDTEMHEIPQPSDSPKDEMLDNQRPPINLTDEKKSLAQEVLEAPVSDSQLVVSSENNAAQIIDAINTPDQAFSVLGIEPGSTPEQIKKAYIKLAWKYHPDTSDLPDATKQFQAINQARDLLDSQEAQVTTNELEPDSSELQKKIQESSADQIVSGLLEDPLMKALKKEVDRNPEAKIDNEAMDAQKNEESFGWSEAMSVLLFLMIDISLNKGRGITSLLEKFLNDKITTNLLVPIFKRCGISEEDIEQFIEHSNETGKAIFQLSPSILKVTLEGMSEDQLRDTVSSLDSEDQKRLLFSDHKRAPNDKLSEDEIEEYFSEESLGSDFIKNLQQKLGVEKK